MELEEATSSAAATPGCDKGASAPVAEPDGTPHFGRHVPAAGILAPVPPCCPLPRTACFGELLLGQGFDEERQRAIEDLPEVAIGDLMAEEIPGQAQLVAGLGGRSELHPIPP